MQKQVQICTKHATGLLQFSEAIHVKYAGRPTTFSGKER